MKKLFEFCIRFAPGYCILQYLRNAGWKNPNEMKYWNKVKNIEIDVFDFYPKCWQFSQAFKCSSIVIPTVDGKQYSAITEKDFNIKYLTKK